MMYHVLGQVAPRRHTQFRQPSGALYHEEVLGSRGFSGAYSTLYHLRAPTGVTKFAHRENHEVQPWNIQEYRQHHLRTKDLPPSGDPVLERVALLFNDDIVISVARPAESMRFFYRNADSDELYFIHEGEGDLVTPLGSMRFGPGDYVVIPRGITYRVSIESGPCRFLIVEGSGAVEVPARYRNEYGQILEHAPYAQRDIRRPAALETNDEEGEFEVVVKGKGGLMAYWVNAHPFDVVGWDGYYYPWAINVADIEPITGRVHQPPPVHQTFQGPNFVVCTFLPRMLDYHPGAVPAPYSHSNVDCDEVLYYASGRFTSRTNVDAGSITLHRHGLPHGPQPGAIEASLGAKETDEVAVMVDTFHPLRVTTLARKVDDPYYPLSWAKSPAGAAGAR